MAMLLPVLPKHEIAKVVRLGTGTTDDAVLKTLRKNGALSDGIRAQRRAPNGRVIGSERLYSRLNADAARAFRRGDRPAARAFAQAAGRIEALDSTKELVRFIAERGSGKTSALVAPLMLRDPLLLATARAAARAINAEQANLPATNITRLSGRVVKLFDDGGVIEFGNANRREIVERSDLSALGLDSEGAELAASWEKLGDGILMMALEPVMLGFIDEEASMDMYGTPWGRALTASDGQFIGALLDRPVAKRTPHNTRVKLPIGE